MTAGKIIALAVVLLLCWPVAQGNNGLAALATVVLFIGGLVMYFVPTMVAMSRDHPNRTAITVLNILLGWTFLGWVGALVWAYGTVKSTVVIEPPKQAEPQPQWLLSPGLQPTSLSDPTAASQRLTKTCPFCAEEVLVAAIKCKHCGSELPAPAAAS